MTYSEKFVACVKVNNRILRETNNTVAIPFGSEYSIFLKNLSSVRALVRVSVDGQDATENVWLIVPANDSLELERFIRNGNFNKGNRFKFIERTSQIEEHRGVGADDGLIRVEYKFETIINNSYIPNNGNWSIGGTVYRDAGLGGATTCYNTSAQAQSSEQVSYSSKSSPLRSMKMNAGRPSASLSSKNFTKSSAFTVTETSASLNDAGITVNGSESNQKFTTGAWFPTETQTHVIVLNIKGAVAGAKVSKAVTVDVKPTCATCGRVNKATNKFCGQCGTALQVFA